MTRPRQRAAGATALLVAALLLSGCGFSVHSGSAPECMREATDDGLSTIDPEGIACIVRHHEARFDMSEGAIDKAALGIPVDELAPDVQIDDGNVRLEIAAPAGRIVASTDYIRFPDSSDDPSRAGITYFLVADSPEKFFAILRAGVDDYGLDGDAVERWIGDVTDDRDGASDFSFAPGTSLGLNVNYDVRYDESKSKQVVIVDVYPL